MTQSGFSLEYFVARKARVASSGPQRTHSIRSAPPLAARNADSLLKQAISKSGMVCYHTIQPWKFLDLLILPQLEVAAEASVEFPCRIRALEVGLIIN